MTVTACRASSVGAPVYSESLPRAAASVRHSRLLISAGLTTWGLDTLVSDATQITAELVSNAVQHTSSSMIRVAVERPSLTRVRLTVSDRSRRQPTLREPDTDAESGRGLVLVMALAERWGTENRRWGKIVWAELTMPEPHRVAPLHWRDA
ncbi:ATP-binding protein [Streptomyces catenulae]|uniref:ATP-binding protein n=1 Tax=Streptomyces catenulae TaxID=66875 RepID=A0ABV2YYC7_9ACTN|nr:ATP-binding protein [Streptomyces catenulae]